MRMSLTATITDNKKTFGLIAFWSAIFLLNTGPLWEKYSSFREMIETVGAVTFLQFVLAFTTMRYLVPNFLEKGRIVLFWSLVFIVIILVTEINIVYRVLYLEIQYPESYTGFLKAYGHMTLSQRLSLFWTLRWIVFNKVPLFLFPTVLLLVNDFYQKQQALLKLEKQKRSAELDALKNQLNPHFIFNTLNNIYALALKKSDQTHVAVEGLSNILDYVVYRCRDEYVDLLAEIELIKDFVALEKIRYRDRLDVVFSINIDEGTKIAPLLLLNLVENACKHGAREELNTAKVRIHVETTENELKEIGLKIEIENSKPIQASPPKSMDQERVGLVNLKKQLEILYPNSHTLKVQNEKGTYKVVLVLEPK